MISISGPLLAKYDSNSKIARDLNSITLALSQKDSSLWGEAAQEEASVRLNWIDLPVTSRDLLPQVEKLRNWVKENSIDNLILCGMGGSSLAPEVFGKVFAKKITVLDSTDPEQVLSSLPKNLKGSLIIVGSKSGSTIETASQKAYFERELQNQGLEINKHLLIITDPNSPLDESSRAGGLKVVNADPNVGGRFSALSAFGLIPAALMGIDIQSGLESAQKASSTFTEIDNVAVKIATLLIEQSSQFIAFADCGSKVPGLSDWIEQLVAESTGKDQKGRVPIVLENARSQIAGSAPLITFESGIGNLSIEADLFEHFILWEWVTALMGRALEVDPFNQPNVTEAKDRTGALLAKWGSLPQYEEPKYSDSNFDIFANFEVKSIENSFEEFFNQPSEYFVIMAYLNRLHDPISQIREIIAIKTKKPTTFGWGPRFLHSTGQFHKGGPLNGAFLQITAEVERDLTIPNKDYSFGTLLMAQALGDGEALSSRNLPLLRIHLKNRSSAIEKLISRINQI